MEPSIVHRQTAYPHFIPKLKDVATTDHTNKSHLDNVCFDVDNKGKPLSNRKLRGLSHLEWIAFNLKRYITTFVRTFMWLKTIFSIIRDRNKGADKVKQIQKLRNAGCIIIKLLQTIASSDELISRIFNIEQKDEIFKKIKEELNKSMHDNDGMSISEITKIIDENGLEYDKSRASEIKILGRGSIASVASVPMVGGGTNVVKVVNKNLEITFLSDKTIISMFLKLISFVKPKTLDKGIVKAIIGFLDTISKEFDLRYEMQNTIIQKDVFEKMKQDKDPFNITEENNCLCKASTHGSDSAQCDRYLENKPASHSQKIRVSDKGTSFYMEASVDIPVEIKVPNVDTKASTRNMIVMDEIHGIPLSSTEDELKIQIIAPLKNLGQLPFLTINQINHSCSYVDKSLRKAIKNFSSAEWSRGLYIAGHCSADMHNGNIMLAIENKKLIIYHIDFGNYISMDKDVVISLYVLMGALKKAVQNQEKKPTTKSDHIDIIMSNLCQLSTSSKEELNISWTEMKIDLLKTINAFDDHLNINLTVLKVFDIGCKYGLHVSPAITGIFRSKLILDS